MSLTRKRYAVALVQPDGPPVEHVVEVSPGDQLRAELEGKKRNLLPKGIEAHPLAFASLMVYFATVRAELYDGSFEHFIHTDCYEFDVVTDVAGKAVSEPVDPTSSEGQSPSDSPSQPASAADPSGGSTSETTT